MSTISFSENTRRESEKAAERYANLNRVRSEAGEATLDGVLLELVHSVAGAKDDVEAAAFLVDLENVVGIALDAIAQDADEAAGYAALAAEAQGTDGLAADGDA